MGGHTPCKFYNLCLLWLLVGGAPVNASYNVSEPFKDFTLFHPPKSRGGRSVCKISEFGCRAGGKCISSDQFCDGLQQCEDGSDEPKFCTPCNRTYYGEWGQIYSISLNSATIAAALGLSHEQQLLAGDQAPAPLIDPTHNKSRECRGKKCGDRSPTPVYKRIAPPQFVCQLTFAAAGDNFGDIVQLMFDSVNIGHYTNPNVMGCPDGSLQVAEINRPLTGGQWCGAGSAYTAYFSETSAMALTLGVFYSPDSLANNVSASQPLTMTPQKAPGSSPPDDFEFKIRYKFIPRSLAAVRFGSHSNPVERGEVVPGSYCSRDFEYCHRRRCKIQSPNYPGLFPRNATCHYTIRHRERAPCKRVLLQVSQSKAHKLQLKTATPSVVRGQGQGQNLQLQEDALLTWGQCSGDKDSLTVYDGNSLEDPVLLVVCGGNSLPPVTSSGSELLVVFRATPFGNLMEPRPQPPLPGELRGFELDVDVVIVDSESAEYTNYKDNCTFFFISEPSDECLLYKPQEQGGNWVMGRRGRVNNPRHTLRPNTTCRYEFKGNEHEVVWIYYSSYSRAPSQSFMPKAPDQGHFSGGQPCASRLTIRDGLNAATEVLIGSFCEPDGPKLCDHKGLQNESRVTRSCSESESYISAGKRLIVEQTFAEGSALRPIHYQFHYEFVSRHFGDGSCSRSYNLDKMKPKGTFKTSDNVFDFGRGGKANLSCSYVFTLGQYDGVKFTVKNASFGQRPCRSITDYESGRSVCHYMTQNDQGKGPRSELLFSEYIWSESNISSHSQCICSNFSSSSVTPSFIFLGRRVVLNFTVEEMSARDSFENFFAGLEYEVLKGAGCRGDNHHMKTESGLIALESSFSHGQKVPSCEEYPWLVEGRENHSLYLRIPGYPMIQGEAKNSRDSVISPPYLPLTTTTLLPLAANESEGMLPPDAMPTAATPTPLATAVNPTTKYPERPCPTTKNRIYIYDGANRLVQKICPSSQPSSPSSAGSTLGSKGGQVVEIYSEDFEQFHSPLFPPGKARFSVEFVGRELGYYQVRWLEIMSIRMKIGILAAQIGERGGVPLIRPNASSEGDSMSRRPSWEDTLASLFNSTDHAPLADQSSSSICATFCPELRACIAPSLWCDGTVHCPVSHLDEKHCDSFWATLNQLLSPAVYVPVFAAAASAICCCGLVILCVALKRTVLKMRSKGQLSLPSSRNSTIDRRRGHGQYPQIPPVRDYFYSPNS